MHLVDNLVRWMFSCGVQVRADRIQSDLEELLKALTERCKKHGVHVKSAAIIELPRGNHSLCADFEYFMWFYIGHSTNFILFIIFYDIQENYGYANCTRPIEFQNCNYLIRLVKIVRLKHSD